MAYTKHNQSFMCRTTRAVRIYLNPTDIAPSGIVLPEKTVFVSDYYITNGAIKLYQISSGEGVTNLPIGGWIPQESLEMTPIETTVEPEPEQTIDDSVPCNESLFINSKNIAIYEQYDSLAPVPCGLRLQDSITVDRKVSIARNGIQEIRYRIISTEAEDQNVVGMWISSASVTSTSGPTVRINTPMARTTFSTNSASGRPTVLDTDSGRGGGFTSSTLEKASDKYDAYDGELITTSDEEAAQMASANSASFKTLYDTYGYNYELTQQSLMSIPIGRMLFVHGMPFQYTHITDRRTGSELLYGAETLPTEGRSSSTAKADGNIDMYGRTFAKEIAANMPVAVIVPGEPSFMTNVKEGIFGYRGNNSVRNGWIPLWSDLTDTGLDSAFANLMNDNSGTYQYYSMRIDVTGYFTYVNAMCQTSARFMGLNNFYYHGKPCTSLDWSKYNSSADQDYSMFEEVIGVSDGVSFAYDPLSSVTDSITNSTGESQFASLFNSISSKSRELEFMAGSAGVEISAISGTDFGGVTSAGINDDNVFQRFTARAKDMLSNTAKGMNVRFPQLWQDSNSSKSYSIDMRFITPYATTFCKWRYVIVPFIHIFALAAPRSDRTIVNYKRPYLIRAFSKGYFNVEMGIIESIQWKRFGDGDMISADGVPTQIDVSIDFQDLYYQLAMSRFGATTVEADMVATFFNNTGLTDMLATMSGCNANRLTLAERLAMYSSSAIGAFAATGSNFMNRISGRVRNFYEHRFMGL